ncbi:uncharacterized protein LOC115743430 isoform X2 [Rhodamnia argentea]|uniref:Uncharacterized protein LOC115743430 isoform X2 n=1 Tax=Rhodamnia argentea TaxID=178133 RepID=A0A8B8PH87_9MYRT|nr:uncharacterized protein LOC115743430 isoform X2 [Rhodamnia argentea]
MATRDQMEAASSTGDLDVDAIRSRARELKQICGNCTEHATDLSPADLEDLLNRCVLEFESGVKQIVSGYSDVNGLGQEDLNAFLGQLKEERDAVQAENNKISDEVEVITRSIMADSIALESDLEGLEYSLDLIRSQGLIKGKAGMDSQSSLLNADVCHKFEALDLQSQIEEKKMLLKSLEHIDCQLRKDDTVEQIEDALTGLKVIEIDGSCIRLSLNTYLPKYESYQQKMEEAIETVELNHELLIELVDGCLELKNVEIFPNDVHIDDIVDAAKAFRQSFSELTIHQTPLEWFVRKVQERVILSTLRRFAVKTAARSRHSLEYIDRDETIIAHMIGGIDALIKVPQGWPVLNIALKLKSLQSSDRHVRNISSSYLRKVEEAANSLDPQRRQNLSSFVDDIEKILKDFEFQSR